MYFWIKQNGYDGRGGGVCVCEVEVSQRLSFPRIFPLACEEIGVHRREVGGGSAHLTGWPLSATRPPPLLLLPLPLPSSIHPLPEQLGGVVCLFLSPPPTHTHPLSSAFAVICFIFFLFGFPLCVVYLFIFYFIFILSIENNYIYLLLYISSFSCSRPPPPKPDFPSFHPPILTPFHPRVF